MYNLLNIYDCPNCGKRLSDEVTHGQSIDCDRDKVHDYMACQKCGAQVTIRATKSDKTGQIIYHYEQVDDERALWAHGFYDDLFKDRDY